MNAPSPLGRPRLVGHAGRPAQPGDLALWLAVRLYARHRGEAVRTLEALAAALARRLAAQGVRGAPVPGPDALPPGDPQAAACRRIARRALAGPIGPPDLAGATRYHHADVLPCWARGLVPLGEFGGFLFYV